MAYKKERSSSSSSLSREKLHSFTFLDKGLKWGAQRSRWRNFDQHRSSFVSVTDRSIEAENELNHFDQNKEFKGSVVMNFNHREDSMVDLERGCEGMKISMVEENGKGKQKVSEDYCIENKVGGGPRSSNLGTWRSASKAPQGNYGDEMMVDVIGLSPIRRIDGNLRRSDVDDVMVDVTRVPIGGSSGGGGSEQGGKCEVLLPVRRIDSRLRSARGMGIEVEQKIDRLKFVFALTKEEIEEDFLAMTGAKPPKKPTRRPKALQRKLNNLVPGIWLGEVTPETYKVDDKPKRKGF